MRTSAISGFSRMPLEEKIRVVEKFSGLDSEDLKILETYRKLPDYSELENNIGPFKIATNFLVNGRDILVPMETEEPSVVAAASRGAKLARQGGGFTGGYLESKTVGIVQLIDIPELEEAIRNISRKKQEILRDANRTNAFIFERGGGAKDLEVKTVETEKGKHLVAYLTVDTLDAMGANIINTMLEEIAPYLSELSGGRPNLKIVSNFAPRRVVKMCCKIPIEKLAIEDFPGEEVAKRIVQATALAKVDVYRGSTHNKGAMNGIDAVVLATGNDFRAVEAGVHSYAARNGKYTAITDWWLDGNYINGKIEVPLVIGTVGGATGTKKGRLALKILGIKKAEELGAICASVGLSNNFAATSAIVSVGIQKGHMKIHRKFLEGKPK
ncbi:MAG: hydroxymethylglutaryl-CoA reductase, degradative [Candidatus Aenigmarchaeota archaeon]|nr:hydroxymethylglutaryl-CoA reductase, degradative [Candidatus Aenigmarchaeota archaeon]